MNEQNAPLELLTAFSGLVHRKPLFAFDSLNAESHQFSFLDFEGKKLDDDADAPPFVERLTDILKTISHHQKLFISMPASWSSVLQDNLDPSLELIIISDKAPADQTIHHDALLIDLHRHNQKSIEQDLASWRENHRVLCAANVDNLFDYHYCKTHQLDLVQGQFYTLPSPQKNHKLSPSLELIMALLIKLQDPEISPDDLAFTINQDINLSYQLLTLVNSAFFGLPRTVSSTTEAVVMLGHAKIKTWATLLSLSSIKDKPGELSLLAMTRARMCELLAKYYKGQIDLFFAAGLFSTLDALMDLPLATVVEKLPLSDELSQALLEHSGPAGSALQDVLNYEQENWSSLATSTVPTEVLARVYLESIHWAQALHAQIQG